MTASPVVLPAEPEPWTGAELVRELRALHEWSTGFWSRFDDRAFFAPLGEAWSPAGNVRHLTRSCRPLARALRLPKLLLLVPGAGPAWRRSRGYLEMRTVYRAALQRGVQAGRYAPPAESPGAGTGERRRLMERRQAVADELHATIDGWSERSLDRFRLPHPALGRLTVREMLFFTLYHNRHHVRNVARRCGWLEEDEA